MSKKIYKVIIFDEVKNVHVLDTTIFFDKTAAIQEAERLFSDEDIPTDSVSVYEEEADRETGAFKTIHRIYQIKND